MYPTGNFCLGRNTPSFNVPQQRQYLQKGACRLVVTMVEDNKTV
jgi:hypothetical protein